jgi:hypothetical protein
MLHFEGTYITGILFVIATTALPSFGFPPIRDVVSATPKERILLSENIQKESFQSTYSQTSADVRVC